jgi:hypothetical protein
MSCTAPLVYESAAAAAAGPAAVAAIDYAAAITKLLHLLCQLLQPVLLDRSLLQNLV